jgi:putative glutamine amidotransferase
MSATPIPRYVVGVTQRIDSVAGRGELRDALDQKLCQWLVQAGFLPVAIPNILAQGDTSEASGLESWLQAIKPKAFILSGGNDIGEYPTRDSTEAYLLARAREQRRPVLGVCRGLQMMANWAGVALEKKTGHVGSRHRLVSPDGDGGWPESVNSFHNWGLVSCPEGFAVSAYAEDGSIEAIRHLELPWEGWMWHPEREAPFAESDGIRLKRLFNEN